LAFKVLKQVYFAFVHSHILYAVEIYANTHKSYLAKYFTCMDGLQIFVEEKLLHTQILILHGIG